jgi:solute carrier family 25 carnitine/acylcarnitine transporter 20/29
MQTATTTTTTAAGGGVGSAATTVSGMLAEIVRSEGGARGLFRGVGAPLLTVVPTTAVAFWGYDVGRRTIASFDGDRPDRAPSGAEVCAAGAMSAFPTALVIVPTERVKCLLQVQRGRGGGVVGGGGGVGVGVGVGGGTRYYSGTIDCARRLLEEGGIRSLYRGTGATLARGVPGTMAYFAAYEATKGAMTGVVDRRDGPGGGGGDGGRPLSPVAVLIAGGIAGVAYWACVVPIIADVIKSRIQTAPPGSYPRGYADVYASVVKEGGHAGLFRGFVPAVMRAIPASMARSLGMEVTRKILE